MNVDYCDFQLGRMKSPALLLHVVDPNYYCLLSYDDDSQDGLVDHDSPCAQHYWNLLGYCTVSGLGHYLLQLVNRPSFGRKTNLSWLVRRSIK